VDCSPAGILVLRGSRPLFLILLAIVLITLFTFEES